MSNVYKQKRRAKAALDPAATITVALTRLERVHTHNFLSSFTPATRKVSWDDQMRVHAIQTTLDASSIEGAKPDEDETEAITLSLRDAEWLRDTAREHSAHATAFALGLVPAIRAVTEEIQRAQDAAAQAAGNGEPAQLSAPR